MTEEPRKSNLRKGEQLSTAPSCSTKFSNPLMNARPHVDLEDSDPTNVVENMLYKSTDVVEKFLANQKLITNQMQKDFIKLSNENQQMKSELAEKSLTIKNLNQALNKRTQELQNVKKNCSQISEANNNTLEKFTNFREKFFNLELFYDNQTRKMKEQIAQCQNKFEEQRNSEKIKMKEMNDVCIDLKKMVVQKTEMYLLLDQKYCEMLKDLQDTRLSLQNKDDELVETKKNFLASSKAMEDNFQDTIKRLNEELEQKKSAYDHLLTEKNEMEEQKNNIINEQLYKIREIERVFVRPTKSIPPSTRRTTTNSAKSRKTESANATNAPSIHPKNNSPSADEMNKKSTSNSNAVLEQMNDNPMPMNSNATKRALPVATERRVSKRVRKNVNCNTDNHNKDTNYELNDKNEEIVEAVAINNPKTNNENDSGINLSLTKNMHKTSIENNKQYELLSSSSDDNSSESSYILWGPKPVAENDVFVPDTSDTSDIFSRLKNSD